eukprot:CAMPEP_0180825210 /NCGR_PEP_ID=MMETSP1038_2-20121128/72843_1 /TAXON_ID=632150 /ORGANISM="Azadinium spinosum, Strain 3D9" /LENGTH=75 /DNA_ID=CAMNT_0022867645 /DNA_START=203 /DNA_END=430 /DNA_ORIENTATION=+
MPQDLLWIRHQVIGIDHHSRLPQRHCDQLKDLCQLLETCLTRVKVGAALGLFGESPKGGHRLLRAPDQKRVTELR